MKVQNALTLLFLSMALILTACKAENTVDTKAIEIPPDKEETVVKSAPDDSGLEQLEYWDIDEFEIWMEQQHEKNSALQITMRSRFTTKTQMRIIIAENGHRKMLIRFITNGKNNLPL